MLSHQVMLLQRVVAYFCFLERKIEHVCQLLGKDISENMMSAIQENIPAAGQSPALRSQTIIYCSQAMFAFRQPSTLFLGYDRYTRIQFSGYSLFLATLLI